MSIFGDFKKMVNNADKSIKNASKMQEKAMKDQEAASKPLDMNDPMWQPIEGITLDKYAEITAMLGKNAIMGVDNVNAYAESKGVKKGTWSVVQTGWVQRMQIHEPVRTRYGHLYSSVMST